MTSRRHPAERTDSLYGWWIGHHNRATAQPTWRIRPWDAPRPAPPVLPMTYPGWSDAGSRPAEPERVVPRGRESFRELHFPNVDR